MIKMISFVLAMAMAIGAVPIAAYDTAPSVRVANEHGEQLDTLYLKIDGVSPYNPLEGVFRSGRIWFDAREFSLALGLPKAGSGGTLALFDLCELHGLLMDFNRKAGVISLYSGYQRPERLPIAGERSALMRLEDVMATVEEWHSDELIKMRTVADLFWSHSAHYSIAWVPVFVNPKKSVRNDPREYSRYNTEFVFTLDYMISRGGELGLHGYTHQRGDEISIGGPEFGPGTDEAATRKLFRQQLDAAADLGWKPHSFTFPKYVGTKRQFEIAGEYFDVIWPNPYNRGNRGPHHVKAGQRDVIYLNTPEDHVIGFTEEGITAMIKRLQNAGEIAGFFFHANREYASISVERNGSGPPVINYDTNSPLHRILDTLGANGRVLRSLTHFQG
jgi:hypothetical protein